MSRTFLDRYLWEAEAHANELLDLFDEETRLEMPVPLAQIWENFLQQMDDPPKAAFVLLGEGPTAQVRRLAKLDTDHAAHLWLQARFLALQAARSFQIAARLEQVRGMGYREAVRYADQETLPFQEPPSPYDIAMLRLGH